MIITEKFGERQQERSGRAHGSSCKPQFASRVEGCQLTLTVLFQIEISAFFPPLYNCGIRRYTRKPESALPPRNLLLIPVLDTVRIERN